MADRHKVALVTGGGTGIGAATARRLAADGWRVAITGRRSEPLEAVAAETGGLALVSDTALGGDVERAVAATVDAFGGLDGLVLNAGVGGTGSLLDADPARFEEVVRINLVGPFLVARAAIRHLLATRGAIVTVSSDAGLGACPSSLAYCSSKAGLIHLTRCMAVDHGPDGVRANCVCPGWVRTPMADGEMDELADVVGGDREQAYATVTRDVPARRPSTPDEIAAAIAWLLSPDASYVNGAALAVDGGGSVVDVGTVAFGALG